MAVQPNRPNAFLRRLAWLLIADELHRPRPPISLPGRLVNWESLVPESARVPPAIGWVRLACANRLCCEDPRPEDAEGPYDRDRLLRMNARFVARLERAFARGVESRSAAGC
jgi:hypothetical protein